MDDTSHKSAQNYELLIRVDEQLKNLTREVREMGGAINQRVALIEATKISKEEVVERFNEVTKITDAHTLDIDMLKTQAIQLKTMIKTWGSIALIVIGALQFIQIIVSLIGS